MLYKNLPENELRHVMRVRFWEPLPYAVQFVTFTDTKAIKEIILNSRSVSYLNANPILAAYRDRISKDKLHIDNMTKRHSLHAFSKIILIFAIVVHYIR